MEQNAWQILELMVIEYWPLVIAFVVSTSIMTGAARAIITQIESGNKKAKQNLEADAARLRALADEIGQQPTDKRKKKEKPLYIQTSDGDYLLVIDPEEPHEE